MHCLHMYTKISVLCKLLLYNWYIIYICVRVCVCDDLNEVPPHIIFHRIFIVVWNTSEVYEHHQTEWQMFAHCAKCQSCPKAVCLILLLCWLTQTEQCWNVPHSHRELPYEYLIHLPLSIRAVKKKSNIEYSSNLK